MGTETVTVVFTDLVGSTALLSQVGEEAGEALRREHFGLLRGAVEPVGGREVKNLGDGLMVVFSSAADAVAGSVAVQQAVEARNRRAEHVLLVRVGIAVGDADVEDGDYFGVPVVEAARLCAQAAGAEILTTDMVRLMAGSRGGFVFEPVGDLDLKGLDGPVPACRVGWESLDESQSQPALPGRLASAVAANFVGREAEHDRLMTAWKGIATHGQRRLILVGGEPGIGKTTLAARFAQHVHDEGAVVVYGRCDEDLGIPYQPWIEALTSLVAHAPEQVLVDHLADRGGHLARLVPGLAKRMAIDPPTGGVGDSERFVLFGCVTDLLERLSAELPVLVVLDDLHWADRATVQLLRHVVTSEPSMAAGVLGTYRDSEIGVDHPVAELLAKLHREGGVERILLHGLSDADVLGLLEQMAGHAMTEDGVALRDAVLAETAGNPFFVGEIVRHLAETGAIFQDADGRWVSDVDLRAVGLPVSVKEVVGRRLAGLGPDTDRVLAFAAVIGRDFDIPLLAAVAQLDEDAVVDLCDAAVSAAVLQATHDPDRYTFAHALIEHTLYDGLSPSRRARAHRAIAEQLERLYGDGPGERSGELAHHWAAAVQPTDTAKAIHFAQVAAARALDQLAPDEALRWYTQAHDLLERAHDPDPRQEAEVLVGVGDAQRQCGLAEHRDTLIAAARLADRIDAVDLLVRAALANSRGFESITGGKDHDRVAIIDLALERLTDPSSPERARLLALAAMERFYDAEVDVDERLARSQEAVATARRANDPATLAAVLYGSANAVRAPVTLDQRVAWLDEACALADDLGDPVLRLSVHTERSLQALEQGDLQAIRQHRRTATALVERVPQASAHWISAYLAVWPAILEGDLPEAERRNDAALTLGLESAQPDAMTFYGGQLTNIRYHQGRLDELIPLIEEVLADASALEVFQAVLAIALASSGETARAAAMLDDVSSTGLVVPIDNSWTTALAFWAEVTVKVGNLRAAEQLRAHLLPFHGHVTTTQLTVQPCVAHNLGTLDHLLGHLDQADAWFAEAMAIHDGLESPPLIAATQAVWASCLVDRDQADDHARARAMAESALATATAGGYGYTARDAAAVLQRLS